MMTGLPVEWAIAGEVPAVNRLRLVCIALVVALAACKGNDGGRPTPPSDLHEPELRESDVHFEPIATVDDDPFVYNDNVFVLPVADSLGRVRLPIRKYTAEFYEYFDDAFDFLLFVSNIERPDQGIFGSYRPVSNDTVGIGQRTFSKRAYRRLAARLQGVMHFPGYDLIRLGPSLHELMHRWANHVVPWRRPSAWANFFVPGTRPSKHWGFSSAYGQLGGFRPADLVDHGNGRYSAGKFGPIANNGNSVPYSPLELYLAGFLALEEVPDLTIAEDGEWVVDKNGVYAVSDSRHLIFTASQLRIYTAEDLVAEHGERVPAYPDTQRSFRAATILLIDEDHPATRLKLDTLSEDVSWFSDVSHGGGSLPDGRRLYNFFGATGGRAMIEMDDLLRYNTRTPVAEIDAQVSSEPPSPQDSDHQSLDMRGDAARE